jgi:hypothetical protein
MHLRREERVALHLDVTGPSENDTDASPNSLTERETRRDRGRRQLRRDVLVPVEPGHLFDQVGSNRYVGPPRGNAHPDPSGLPLDDRAADLLEVADDYSVGEVNAH